MGDPPALLTDAGIGREVALGQSERVPHRGTAGGGEDLGSDDGAGWGIGAQRGQTGGRSGGTGLASGERRERGGGPAWGGVEIFLQAFAGDASAGPGRGGGDERSALPTG